ncbi:MAG: Uma2 family endonuclease [Gemmatimonadaceae bacterium]
MQPTSTLMTIDQLLASPLANEPVELVAGVIRPLTPTSGAHGLVCYRILLAIGPFVEARKLGALFTEETAFVLKRNPDTLRCPDVAFVARDRLPSRGVGTGWMQLAPDLAIEVLSPSDSASEMSAKVQEYLDAGVRLIWVADPATRTVRVFGRDGRTHLSQESDVLDGGDVVPGFTCTVASLFEGVARE